MAATAEVGIVLTADATKLTQGFAEGKRAVVDLGEAADTKLGVGFNKATAGIESTNGKLKDTSPALGKVTTDAGATDNALAGLHTTAGVLDQALGKVGLGSVSLSSALGYVLNPITLLSGGFLAVVGAGAMLVSNFLDVASSAKALALAGGTTATEAVNIGTAFRLVGVDADALDKAIFKVSSQIDDGGKKFEKYGISIRDRAGDIREPMDVLLELRDRISDTGSTSERNAALVDIFGRAGRELAPAFEKSREEFQALRDLANDKMPWSEEQQQMAKDYKVAMRDLGIAWDGLKVQLGTPIMGVVSITFKGIADFMSGKWTQDLKDAVSGALDLGPIAEQRGQDVVAAETKASEAASAAWSRWAQSVKESGASAYTAVETRAQTAEVSITDALDRALAARSNLTQREIQLRNEVYTQGLQAVQRFVTEQDILVNIGVAKHELSERQALDAKLGFLEIEKNALTVYWNKRVADANNAKDRDAGVWQQMVNARAQALGQIELKEQGNVLARIQLEEKYRIDIQAGQAKMLADELAAADTFNAAYRIAIEQRTTAEIVLHGTEEQAFLQSLDVKRNAEIAAINKSVQDNEARALLYKEMDDRLAIDKEAFYKKASDAEIASITRAVTEGRKIGQTQLAQIDQDHRDAFNKLDVLRANDLISETEFQERKRQLDLDTMQAQLAAVGETDLAWTLKTEDTLRQIDDLLNQYADDDQAREALITRRHQLESESRVRQFQDETFKRNEQDIKETQDLAKAIDAQRTQMDRIRVANLELRAAEQARDEEYFGFIGTQLELSVAKWGDSFDQIKGSTDTFVSGAQTSLSTGFFDFFKTGSFDAKGVFQGMLDGMLHGVSDFLSKQAISGLLSLGKSFLDGFTNTESSLPSILDRIGSGFSALADNPIVEKVIDIGKSILGGLTDVPSRLPDVWSSISSTASGFLDLGPVKSVIGWGTSIWNGITDLPSKLSGMFTTISNGVGTFLDTPFIKNVIGWGTSIWNGITDLPSKLSGMFTTIYNGVGTFLDTPFIKKIVGWGIDIWNGFLDLPTKLANIFTTISNGVSTFMDLSWVKKVISLGENLWDGFVNMMPKLSTFLTETLPGWISALMDSEVVKKLLEWGGNFFEGITSWLGLGFATGGRVGPGPNGVDTIPAWLSPGEIVLNPNQSSMFLELIDRIAGTNLATQYSTGTVSAILENLLGFQAGQNWAHGGLRGLLFGLGGEATSTEGLIGSGGFGTGLIGETAYSLFEMLPIIGAVFGGLMSGGNPEMAMIGALGSGFASASAALAAGEAALSFLGAISAGGAMVVAGWVSALSTLFMHPGHYVTARRQAQAEFTQEFPDYMWDIEMTTTPAGVLAALANTPHPAPEWSIRPPADWQTNPHPAPSEINIGYLNPNTAQFRIAGETLSKILHRQWDLTTKAGAGDGQALTELQHVTEAALAGKRAWREVQAMKTYRDEPLDTLDRLISMHIDPHRAPKVLWDQVDWSSMGFTGVDQAIDQELHKFPDGWSLYHEGGIVRAKLLPGELVVPRPFTEEVLQRAASAQARAADTAGDTLTVERIDVHLSVQGTDLRNPSQRRETAQLLARDLYDALEDEKRKRRR